MLDLFGIMFSSIIMVLVILRAIQLDSTLPWFRPEKVAADNSGLRLRPELLTDDGGGPGRALPLPRRGRGPTPP